MNRAEIATLIAGRLEEEKARLRDEFTGPHKIRACRIENLLPTELAERIYSQFPQSDKMVLKHSIKENKHIAAQMDQYDPILEDAVYAFQDARVLDLIGQITGIPDLEPDVDLYAGGISSMSQGAYLRPHLDNSHDKDRTRYRVLNLLYYVTPGWTQADGGSLQLWDDGPKSTPRTIPSDYNSLVIMLTNRGSWHSVNEVVKDGRRCCVSNYYFSHRSPDDADYFHATSFRGEYGKGLADLVMRADNALRTRILNSPIGKIWRNPHVYDREGREKDK